MMSKMKAVKRAMLRSFIIVMVLLSMDNKVSWAKGIWIIQRIQ